MGYPNFRYGTLAGSILLLLGSQTANASGFSLPEISTAGLGTSNAIVANPELLGAVPYNPSLAVFHKGTSVSAGVNLIRARSHVTPQYGTPSDFQGQNNVLVPNLSLTHQINDQVALTFNTTVPLGLSTDYPVISYPTVGTFALLGAASPTKTQVETVDLSPSVAFKVNQDTALALGVDYYIVRKVAFNSILVQNEGNGRAWGWNISASHVAGPWSFGASFRSHARADINGETTVVGTVFGGTSTTLDIPWRAQIGARYRVNHRLALEADITRTGWSSFNRLVISNPSVPIPPSVNGWKDANAYRLGGTYQLNGATQLRFGYSYDKTGMPDAHFSARIADADRQLFSVGLERQLGNGFAIEGGYMLVKFRNKNFSSTSTSPDDPNGSLAYNGDYKTTVNIFGIGVSKRF